MTATVLHGECIAEMRNLADASVDAIVTDPPYGLGFMGKAWDDLPPGEEWARECLRVLKPGGHLLAFGGTRTWHRLAVAVEDAGFEIRDSIAWLYGSGFPKSLDVSKSIDRAAGATREVVGKSARHVSGKTGQRTDGMNGSSTFAETIGMGSSITAPGTPEAEQWQGWGTALKPAHEPIIVARKPLQGTVAANVQAHGTGALNIDATRIDMGEEYDPSRVQRQSAASAGMNGLGDSGFKSDHEQATYNSKGRWPANVILDEDQAAALDAQSGTLKSGALKPHKERHENASSYSFDREKTYVKAADQGGASRFFYCAKAPKKERPVVDGVAHPTVKPLSLMRWLVRLATPPGGTVLDPFAGSGTTLEAAILEGVNVVGIEREAEYLPLIRARLDRVA